MAFLDTKYKRKSALYTSIIGVLILVIIFWFGLTYFDPPLEYGIAVNFGTSDVGSGNVQPTEALKPAASSEAEEQPLEEVVEELIEEPVEEVQPEEADVSEEAEPEAASEPESSEEVITQEQAEAIAIKKREDDRKLKEAKEAKEAEEAKKEAERKAEAKRKAEAEQKRQAEIERQKKVQAEKERVERERKEQAAKRANLDALMGGISDGNGKADGGEGDDNQPGDKGKETGDPNASGYYGIGGDGSGGNYRLGNRKAREIPVPNYNCNEQGKVVVSIRVDQSGKVISAQPGAKGTTNSAACLLEEAKKAALKASFNADSNAPATQAGEIIYNFSLSR